jgi:hypothetical protein
MPRKNKNARKVYKIDFARFAKAAGLTPMQRINTIRFINYNLKEIIGGEK